MAWPVRVKLFIVRTEPNKHGSRLMLKAWIVNMFALCGIHVKKRSARVAGLLLVGTTMSLSMYAEAQTRPYSESRLIQGESRSSPSQAAALDDSMMPLAEFHMARRV